MGSSDKTPHRLGRGDFIRGLASVVIGASLADGEASAEPLSHHHPHETTFQLVADRLAGSPSMVLPDAAQADLDDAVSDMVDAFGVFRETLTDTMRRKMLFPLDKSERTKSRPSDPPWPETDSFGAVLTWCVPGWGLTIGELNFPQRSAFEAFLRTALGVSGYDMVVAIRNRQHVIGVLETYATSDVIAAAMKHFPDKTFANLGELLEALKNARIPVPPDAVRAVNVGGLNPTTIKPGIDDWVKEPHPLERQRQFKSYAIAVFGTPGDGTWAVRIEGHHLSVNLTFLRKGDKWEVHGTPIFVGAFPIIVPPPVTPTHSDPHAWDNPLTWQQGQSLGLALTLNIKRFWSALPEQQRADAFRKPEMFSQKAPLRNETPVSTMLTALDLRPDTQKIVSTGPYIATNGSSLPPAARRHLAAVFDELLSVLHPAVAVAYRSRLDTALKGEKIVATWAGGDLAEQGSQHFSSIAVGTFLVELLQTPQYSVSNTQLPWSNHLHVMLRDLQSPVWGDPLAYHEQHDHQHDSA
jgi:hypothetical protein